MGGEESDSMLGSVLDVTQEAHIVWNRLLTCYRQDNSKLLVAR